MDRNLWIPSFTTGKNFSASRLFTQDASFLTFFLPFSLSFSFFFFFSLPSSWFDRSRGMQRAIYNASVFESISEENYHRSLWESPFTVSSFLFVSAIHILSAVRNEQSFFLFNELVSAVFVFCTHLSCLFDKVSNSYRPYPSVERAWFYLHPCWTARPIFGRDDNFKDCLQGCWLERSMKYLNAPPDQSTNCYYYIFDRLHFPYFPRNSLLSWLLIQEFTSDSWSIR